MEELQLNINLGLEPDLAVDKKKEERVTKAKQKKKEATAQPTWDEVWHGGFGSKKGIYQTKLTPQDKEKLRQVKEAVENEEIGVMVESLKKFSKSHAMNLYKHLMAIRRDEIIQKMIDEKPENYHLIVTEEDFRNFLPLLAMETVIGLDTETNGLDYDKHHIVGISFTLPIADYHCYIPVRHENEGIIQLDPLYVFEQLKPYLQNKDLGKVLHNAKFDMHMFYKESIYLWGVVMDTLVAMKILNENELSYMLKNISTKYGKYFGFEDKSMTYEELFGNGGFENTPLDIGTVYACKDTHLCYKLYKWILEQFKRLPKLKFIYEQIENPLLYVSFNMEINGFKVDLDFAHEYTKELTVEVEELSKKLLDIFGDINMNSPKQLADVLYDKLGLEDITGKRSTDKDTINLLAEEDERVALLLEYRGKYKLLNTYFIPLPEKIWKRDGRLHGKYNQNGTKTGRYSSNDPNLQNIPPKARPIFIAPERKVIIGKDLSQIEPRCLAFMSGDKEFQEPYMTGKDLYSTLASKVFKLEMEYCLDGAYDPTHKFKPRKRMKTGLLAVMYGTSTYTLSKQLDITVEEAEQFIEDFLNNYPEAKAYIQSIKDFVDKNEYVETFNGRKRRFRGHKEVAMRYHAVCKKIQDTIGHIPSNIWDEKYKKTIPYKLKQEFWAVAKKYGRTTRQAVNFVIQGSSADYIKQVMIRVSDYLKTLGSEYKMLCTIHDEILMEVPDTIAPEIIAELDRIMTGIEWFKFPVKTDTVVMLKWGEETPVKEWLENRAV